MENNTRENETAPARKKSKAPWIIAIVVALLAAAAAILIPRLMEQRRLERYDQGTELLYQKDYEQAREVFLALGDYKDASDRVVYAEKGIAYTEAKAAMDKGEYETAAAGFEKLTGFEDAGALAEECRNAAAYAEGKALFESGIYTEASEAFTRANGYKDAEALAEESLNAAAYVEGKALFESGSYADALEAFTRANGYKDAEDMAEETRRAIAYESGKALFDEGSYAEAVEELEQAGDFKDSHSLILECRVLMTGQEISDAMERRDYAGALELLDSKYGSAVDDHDALVKECNNRIKYAEAEELLKKGLNYSAYKAFTALGSFEDARDRAAGCILPTPSTGETYHNPAYKASGCTLKIVPNTASGTNTYFKVYKVEGEKEILVSCVFIRGGATATIKLPAGTYVLKTSSSTGSWYGPTDMFGDDGYYQRLKNGSGSDRFKLSRGGRYTLTMKTQTGDVTGKKEPRQNF
ncbi:MAG: tetratricopeptide repeat protein [Oscillospiraceae bacterium]|nr:tetratricopeptide repeat protein [Oscillospiraceae bacterium]